MVKSQSERDSEVECRFLYDVTAPDGAFQANLRSDAKAAQLSPAFRAYYRLRSLIPLPVRQLLQRHRQIKPVPNWYLPEQFVAAMVDDVRKSADGVSIVYPWPDGANFAFVPTHDVETADGMRRIEKIAALEEELGFRSSWNVVPHKYPVDRGLLRDLQSRGFEIGVHGYNHDGKLFTSKAIFDRRAPAINAALKDFGAVGFRAPMVHRNLAWLQSLDVEYDASYFDIDPFQAMPGGVGSLWPFVAGRFVELPYTLPQDHTLFVALNETSGRIWEEKLDFVAKLGGMALFITHPDYLDSDYRIDAYRRLLEKARAMQGMWHALPKEVAAWWRERDQSQVLCGNDGQYRIEGPAVLRGRVATINVVSSIDPDRTQTIELREASTERTVQPA